MLRASLALLLVCGCGSGKSAPDAAPGQDARPEGDAAPDTDGAARLGLRINEVVPDDDGFLVDEDGQTDDWLELYNASAQPLDLGSFTVTAGSASHALPS